MQEIRTLPRNKKARLPKYNDVPEEIAQLREHQTVRRGDIYHVVMTEPVTGSEMQANRPAVVVSNDVGNTHSPVVEVVYLTTRTISSKMPTQVEVNSAPRPSIALCENVHTVSKRRLERFLGTVTEEELKNIDNAVLIGLGMPRENETVDVTYQKERNKTMQNVTIKTKHGEMEFSLPDDKAAAIILQAMAYASEAEETVCNAPAGKGNAVAVPKTAEKPVLPTKPAKRVTAPSTPISRVERMFPGFHRQNSKEDAAPAVNRLPRSEERRFYTGFLMIRCKSCGEIRGFCANHPVNTYKCKNCGDVTELGNLRPATVECSCGGEFHYRTNIDDPASFKFPCLNCEELVTLEYDPRSDQYVTATTEKFE